MIGIHNFLVDYNRSTTIDNIERSPLEQVNSFTRRIKFYNPAVNEPLHKFWYYINNAKLIKKTQGKISVVLSSTDTKLVESVKSLDDKINNVIKMLNGKASPDPSIVENPGFPTTMELYIDNSTTCFDQDNNPINFMRIKNGSKILLYIELDSVTISMSKALKLWRVLQMKEIQSIDMSVNLFSTPINVPMGPPMPPAIPQMAPLMGVPVPPMMQPYGYPGYYPPNDYGRGAQMNGYGPPPPPPLMPPNSSMSSIPPPPTNSANNSNQKQGPGGSVFQAPTTDQLMNMIGKLKKATKRDDSEPNKETVKKVSPPTPTNIPSAPPAPPMDDSMDKPTAPPVTVLKESTAPTADHSRSQENTQHIKHHVEPSQNANSKKIDKADVDSEESSSDRPPSEKQDDLESETENSTDSSSKADFMKDLEEFIEKQKIILASYKRKREKDYTYASKLIDQIDEMFKVRSQSSNNNSVLEDEGINVDDIDDGIVAKGVSSVESRTQIKQKSPISGRSISSTVSPSSQTNDSSSK
ncbi:hypothetical protein YASMINEVIRUS_337 [Yasminevirus sp. GU-2018]|uniref:Uncharacterized protein n=1 Tax=Yasminevirus sp. GU-2018 TaxID=2420051 RepID=A0A5K0U8S2_9VIRU|nr:hypothetical protein YASMINEVIRUS_337 [Yasminevirus sp. GU-2018]